MMANDGLLCSLLQSHCPQLARIGPDPVVIGITDDSRLVRPGYLFVALQGWQQDGARFIDEALSRGAVAVLQAEEARPYVVEAVPGVACLFHPQPRRALAILAALFMGDPGRSLRLIAVTGTNGKTTTTFMLASILRQAGWSSGIIGTTGIVWPDGHVEPNAMTTPGPVQLQRCLHQMAAVGCQALTMEVSSHALDQQRVAGLCFETAIFTNLTRDHLDYHGSEEAYFAAKAKLFQKDQTRQAVLHLDDGWSERLMHICHHQNIPVLGYRLHRAALTTKEAAQATMALQLVGVSWQGLEVLLWHQGRSWPLSLPVAGLFNATNAAAAAAAAYSLGIDPEYVVAGLAAASLPPGRMQMIQAGQPFTVAVDYAHTPDALERLLRSARELTPTGNKVIVVFGCGGERDRAKRPMMGRAATQWADVAIITDDNPRSEMAAEIRRAILQGAVAKGAVCHEIADRAQAIALAITLAQGNDVVLIAGKGHEQLQISLAGSTPFNDVQVATAAITKLLGR
ncbi:MAG: UDP-N-acetylmuramoyl-L-alanyl-D-glutamate--2,6-diaminopimelate ligase [Magnetococcales bacterium]|nr:UDP-N-acetylmuramoyl-L-alanyl-D-glutamate--2,6-diaminopimelate ligase [Magnetococcales bacterium]